MIHETSFLAVSIFALFVAVTLGLSFYFGAKARSSQGYFAAHGQIHWFVNGIAFAGDYLSAASFLGICGMIAFFGYDGFLYSIGYLAGWVVALFVIAEPLRRLGKYTFADALDAKFHSKGIKLAAAVSTLAISVFYLIPQMVGAGVLIQPLLGLPHWIGVLMVGAVVVLIVVTAGMVSTTYVQFLKGSLLVLFSTVLTILILKRGFVADTSSEAMTPQTVTRTSSGDVLVNGQLLGTKPGEGQLRPVGHITKLPGGVAATGPVGPLEFFSVLRESEIVLWRSKTQTGASGTTTTYLPEPTPGDEVLRPGKIPAFRGIRGEALAPKLDFLSLMLALFCGTASLPHILIRYYTVKDEIAARKSTVVGIASIGFFYVLTLYMGLGAMTSGALDVTDSNMSAPLLARSFGEFLFAVISAIAFTTVLGTVSGLIVAASGAVVHDLVTSFFKIELADHEKVRLGKFAAVGVGAIAILLGILFQGLNVSFLVGWAFSVAASANLPALVMVLFWSRTTKQGVTWAIIAGMVSSLGWILASEEAFTKVYGLSADAAWVPFSQPGIVTIPLGFLVLVVVSLLTQPKQNLQT
ncbi:MAG: cation acetate symporter [Gemmataceae bacterium]|nr:cation acetate symporter [Gemmataceae bacterium]MCI0741351.1 cation acetate symporter [Gemmataceae bacterium]